MWNMREWSFLLELFFYCFIGYFEYFLNSFDVNKWTDSLDNSTEIFLMK